MRRHRSAWLLTLTLSLPLAAQPIPPLTAEAIMARVAANQDAAEAERLRYIYTQHAITASRKGSTVLCEEITDTRITPTPTSSQRQLLQLDGRLLQKHHYLTYNTLSSRRQAAESSDSDDVQINLGEETTDRDLVESMRESITDTKSKDGINQNLFPLTSKSQHDYLFRLLGQQQKNGHTVYHIEFTPRDKDEFTWKGEAYIDTAALQPILVRTTMARKIPFAVRALLGTNVPGLGFTILYAPQSDGVWFPTSFGTEFKIHVLFFFNRQITFSAENRDFTKTHVTSQIVTTPTGPETPQPQQPSSPEHSETDPR